MPPLWTTWLAALLCVVPDQGAVVQDAVRAQYYEALGAAPTEGLLTLVARLDAAATSFPASHFTPKLQEMIQVIGLVHPGSVPDRASRLQRLKEEAARNIETAAVVRRIGILAGYIEAASRGRPEEAEAGLTSPELDGWAPASHARADAAFRSGNVPGARILAHAAIEADPLSPLLAPDYVLLALCDVANGKRIEAARHLQRALSVSPLPTIYGRTQDLLLLLSRFVRPVSGRVGRIYDESSAVRLVVANGLKDPRAIFPRAGVFRLLDREQFMSVSVDGKVTENRPARNMEDVAAAETGAEYFVAEDSVDLGSGMLVKVQVTGARKKTLGRMRSIALDQRGDAYVLDEDAGLFRIPAGPNPMAVAVTPVRGRQVRVDRRGFIYILGTDRRSVQIFSREGKSLATVAASGARQPAIEYFALDALNNLYVLDPANNSIQIFAANSTARGVLEIEPIATVPLQAAPEYRDLKVLAVAPTGELVVTGKNDGNWVLYR